MEMIFIVGLAATIIVVGFCAMCCGERGYVSLHTIWVAPLIIYLMCVISYPNKDKRIEEVKTIAHIEGVGRLSKPVKLKTIKTWPSRWNPDPIVEIQILNEEGNN